MGMLDDLMGIEPALAAKFGLLNGGGTSGPGIFDQSPFNGTGAPGAFTPPAGPAGTPPQAAPPLPEPTNIGMLNTGSVPMAPPQAAPPAAPPSPLAGPQPSPEKIPDSSLLARIGDMINARSGTLMGLGAGIAGSQSWGQGISRGLGAALPAMQQDIALEKQNQTVNALIKKGVPKDIALGAAANPAMMAQLLPQVFGAKQLQPVVVGTDKFGQPTHGTFNPATGQYSDITGKPITSATPANSVDPNLTGESFLQTLEKPEAEQTVAMLEGRSPPPTAMALKSPYWQRMMQNAAQAEPGFDLGQWQARNSGLKDFASGKSSEMVRSANQTIHHVGELVGSMDNLHNGQYPFLNAPENYVGEKWLGKKAVTEFRPNAHAVAEELSKVFKGNNMSDSEIHQWEQSLSENMSPEQQRGAVNKLMSLLHGSLDALEDKRTRAIGQRAADKSGPLLNETSRKTLAAVEAWAKGEKPGEMAKPAPPAAPAQTFAPAPNSHHIYDPASGGFTPMPALQ